MPKSRDLGSITYNCDICNFKVTNKYIFKRHLHRCYTLHGIASKRSSPRQPIRLKGTDGVRSVGGFGRLCCEKDNSQSLAPSQTDDEKLVDEMDISNDTANDVAMEGVSQCEDNDLLSRSPMSSSQWSVKDSPTIVADGAHTQDEIDEEDEDETRIVSLNGVNDETMDNSAVARTAYVEDERSLMDSPNTPMTKAKFERNYACEICSFKTVKSRDYLYHLRDNHNERLKIFECSMCDYASRYNNKLIRHMAVHNKIDIASINFEDAPPAEKKVYLADPEYLENTDLKVKPLKLKRLHVKTPSMFQVTHESKVKREPQASPPMVKDVFKMVLSADGSHDYQCRECLFYANSAFAVKKHYNLCHSKLLQCGLCDFSTRSQAEHYEHIITHEGRITYHKCPDCSYVTHAKPTFENHRAHHGSDAPVKCRVCNFAADSESKVKRHMATQHTNRSDSQDSLSRKNERQLQATVPDAENCLVEDNIEGQEFAGSRDVLMMNVENGGSNSYTELVGQSTNKSKKQLLKIKCPHCFVVCLRRANLTRHLVAKHDYTQEKASMSSKAVEKQLFRRKSSQQSYASSLVSSASKFFRQQTSAADQDELQCTECSYVAKWPSDLRRHQQVHTMVKRFKCPICTSKYKYLGDLNVHMRRDHLMEPQQHTIAEEVVSSEVVKKSSPAVFRCPICAYATGTKADLEQHTRQHGDIEKTFQCRQCDYQTYWRGDVGRHLFRHHKISLGKDGAELDKYFIFRPDIRPLTKMPIGFKNEHNIDDAHMDHHIAINSSPSVMQSHEEKVKFKNVLLSVNQSSGGKESSSFFCGHPSCAFRTTTAEKLEIHEATHENIKIFKCPTCGKRANYRWDIVKHMVKVHKNPSASREDVIMLTVLEARETIGDYLSSFERKVVDTPVYRCSICDFKSGEKNLVVQHLDESHPDKDGHVLSFSATVANVKQEPNLSVEGAINTSEDSKVLKFVEPSPEELAKHDKPYTCGICKKPEMTLLDMQRHYNYTHPYKDVRVIYNPDGTEFNMDNFEIYPNVKKSVVAAQSFLNAEESLSSNGSQTSPGKLARSDSKYSNPKQHGYIKPFKCSVCGLRSNWKWDLKKHLRSKHPHEGGFVIMLSIEEAQMTYGKECSRSHPKCETQGITSEVSSHMINTSPNFNDSFSSNEIHVSVKNKIGQVSPIGTSYDPGRRQWKCSGCDYITNWRRNMARHMNRRHKEEKHLLKVIALHMLHQKERDTILEERKIRMEKIGKVVVDLDDEEEAEDGEDSANDFSTEQKPGLLPFSVGAGSGADGKLWKCPKCSYHSTLRTHIIIHMQKHELRPFLCAVCNAPFMNRSPLHIHIQKAHGRSDYVKLVKVNIRYDGVIDQSHLGITQQQKEVYQCILCKVKYTARSSVLEHLKSSHGVEGNDHYITMSNIPTTDDRTASHSAISNSKLFAIHRHNRSDGGGTVDSSIIRRKIHYCRVCPYTTQKKSMLSFHMTYHKPTPANRFKCKYCPYYVSTTRLLHQHQRKWHSDSSKKVDASNNAKSSYPASILWEYPQSTPPSSPSKQKGGESGTPRRHACGKCPYTTNCRNDFYYHKQFHRPKRTAEYKCEHCDYWVVHKRLLKQHMRLHEQENMEELSPAKSVYSDPGLVYDPVELTELAALKQNMISAKILPSLSKSPKVSPMKIASRCSADDKPGYVWKNGMYRKLHKCPKCPYTNTRARNMNLHIMMHGPRESTNPLMRCPYCDYYVGSKGLLSHHMKVHQKQYGDTPENDARKASLGLNYDDDEGDDSDDMVDIQAEQKVDTLLQISRMKRFGCEKCPYASAKRQHFERHLELHGSRQRYTCQHCDYSVPSSYLLTQHSRLHLMPNQNLLSCQSVNNLQRVGEVPADVALASALPPSDSDMSVTISVVHDHLGLYENSIYDPEQRKLYRCDRCPYANVRRDHLLSHLKFHMVSSSFVCPYCDYSAPKQALLTQHIRVHFCPLPELSEWLLENGQTERETSQRKIDMAEALKVAKEYQSQSKKKGKVKEEEKEANSDKVDEKENIEDKSAKGPEPFICQYCDREFVTSEKLVKHELQHLIGNQFEMALKMLNTEKPVDIKKANASKSENSSLNVDMAWSAEENVSEIKTTESQKEEFSREETEDGKDCENEDEKQRVNGIENIEHRTNGKCSPPNNASLATEDTEKEKITPKDTDVEMKCDDYNNARAVAVTVTDICTDNKTDQNDKAENDVENKQGQIEKGKDNEENMDVESVIEEDSSKVSGGEEIMEVDEEDIEDNGDSKIKDSELQKEIGVGDKKTDDLQQLEGDKDESTTKDCREANGKMTDMPLDDKEIDDQLPKQKDEDFNEKGDFKGDTVEKLGDEKKME